MSKVSEVMQKGVYSVSPSASISEVARKMRDCGVGTVPVCEKGKLRGIITERSIVFKLADGVSNHKDHKREYAGSLMYNKFPEVPPGAGIIEAARIMASHRTQSLPVVEDGNLVGVLTLDDLVKESPALAVMVIGKR